MSEESFSVHENMPDTHDREIPFEFERKFYVRSLPSQAREDASQSIIVQAYVFAEAGYAVRVRMVFHGLEPEFPKFHEATDYMGAYERRVLQTLIAQAENSEGDEDKTVTATIAVKSPPVSGERYELENELDRDVAAQIIYRSSRIVLKTRYSLWYGEDGWEFDVFGGQNAGLIVAECERISPVVNLTVPKFCITEVTGDLRFTNDFLSKEPWSQWQDQFRAELEARGPFFLDLKS